MSQNGTGSPHEGARDAVPAAPGRPAAGRGHLELPGYTSVRALGAGGTGEVWEAVETASGERVALKRLRRGAGPDAQRRLVREADLLSALRHPHLVRLRAVVPVGDELVLVLDHAAGGSVAQLLGARGVLAAGEVVTLVTPVAQALEELHRRGVVHGDVAPANIVISADGRPLLADLGVARVLGELVTAVEGRAAYLDPAVLAGAAPSGSSDVYALAAVGREALGPEGGAGARDPDAVALRVVLDSALQGDPLRRPTAGELAASVYAACPAAPLLVVDGTATERAAVPVGEADTHRVRRRPLVVPEPPQRPPLWRRMVRRDTAPTVTGAAASRRRRQSRPGRRAGSAPGSADEQARPGLAGTALRVAATAGCTAALLGLAVLAGAAWAGAGIPGPARITDAGEAAPASEVPAPSDPAQTAAPTAREAEEEPQQPDVRESGESREPGESGESGESGGSGGQASAAVEWSQVLAELDSTRSTAFATGDVDMLASIYAPGSPAGQRDEAALQALTSDGSTMQGVVLTTVEVAELEVEEERVVLGVSDTMAPHVLVGPTGEEERRAGRPERTWRVTMQPDTTDADGAWLIWDIAVASD